MGSAVRHWLRYTEDEAIIEACEEWAQYRRESKLKPWVSMTWKKALEKWGTDFPAVVEQSISQGWQGLFPLPPQSSRGTRGAPASPPSEAPRGAPNNGAYRDYIPWDRRLENGSERGEHG